ncbi:MAG: efflux RND transporter permease subunit, partial [Pedobacter sp.]
ITMATAIILSGIVALTLTPALCAIMLKKHSAHPKKKALIDKGLDAFNAWFFRLTGRYQKLMDRVVTRKLLLFGILGAFCVGTYFLSNTVPSGFIPNEDQGMIYAIIQTPPGSTLERTNQVSEKLEKICEGIEGVKSVSALAGYEVLTEGTGSNSGTCLINLKDWKDRKNSAQDVIKELEEKSKDLPGATVEFFQPPAVPGYGAAGGFELRLVDKAGNNDYVQMEKVSKDFVKELNKRPELQSVFTFYSASFPQYMVNIDNDKAQQKGVTPEKALETLSDLIGSNYETNFIKFGRQYKVIVQALPQYRALPQDVMKLYVKNNKDQMVPFSSFMTMDKVYGLSEITRHNMYNSAEINGSQATGYSSGEALKAVEEVAKKSLPRGYGTDWAGISKDQ